MLSHFDLKKNYPNGDRYHGEATEGTVKDGKGTYFWAGTGAEYNGEWKRDVMHGKGTYKIPDPSSSSADTSATAPLAPGSNSSLRYLLNLGYTYTGTFIKGLKHGKGQAVFSSGATYTGDWMEGAMEGQGSLSGGNVDNFSQYDGQFQQGLRWGSKGRCVYKPITGNSHSGDIYEGQWKEDLRHGQGQQVFGATGDLYQGTFSNDAATGQGRLLVKSSGEIYIGDVVDGEKHGTGQQQFPDGSCYEGQFSKSSRHGKGCFQGHGLYYEGNWYFNQMEGKAAVLQLEPSTRKSQQLNGLTQYLGDFVSDQLQGVGTGFYEDGRFYQGEWISDHFNGNGLTINYSSPFGKYGSYVGKFSKGLKEGQGEAIFCNTQSFPVPSPSSARQQLIKTVPTSSSSSSLPQVVDQQHVVDSYIGSWSNDVPSGSGKWSWAARGPRGSSSSASGGGAETYTGEILCGLPHGEGSWHHGDGSKFKGQLVRGLRHGKGRMDYPNGNHYDGEWQDGLYSGTGIWGEYDTSNSYNGQWLSGKRNGEGVQIEYGKFHYNGSFANDQRHGRGTMKRNNGEEYSGEFQQDQFHGQGLLSMPDGSSYEGSFANGQCHGYVSAKLPNGNTYKGMFSSGAITGEGEMQYKNMDRYIGSLVNGVRNGRGKFIFAGEGTELECGWQNDVLHGEGVCKKRDGSKTWRRYNEGALEEEKPMESDLVFHQELPSPQKSAGEPVPAPILGPGPPERTNNGGSDERRQTPPPPPSDLCGPPVGVVPMSLRPLQGSSSSLPTAKPTQNNPKDVDISRNTRGSETTTPTPEPPAPVQSAPSSSAATAQTLSQLDQQIASLEGELERGCTEDQRRAFKKKLTLLRATRLREQKAFQSQVSAEGK